MRYTRFRRIVANVLPVIFLCVLAPACVRDLQKPISIAEDSDHFVRLQARSGDPRWQGLPPFDHPAEFTGEEWERLLSSISVQTRKDTFLFTVSKNLVESAFSPEEIMFLQNALRKAFIQASSDDVVVFGLRRDRSPHLSEFTTGGWFREGTYLHLILANYRQAVTMSHIREQLWKDPLHSNTGPSYEVIPKEYQRLEKAHGISALFDFSPSELLIEYAALLKASSTPLPHAEETTPPKEQGSDVILQGRLQTLKKLREEDLITEEEYREQKKHLLEQWR